MPSLNRRAFLASLSAVLLTASGCTAFNSSPTPAHWVSVYLGERDETHDVTVTVTNDSSEVIFEKDYRLSESNEADENVPFPESTDPETVIVTVDGIRFERDWLGSEHRQLPCSGQNWSGIELWIENSRDGSPGIRMEADCQHVTIE